MNSFTRPNLSQLVQQAQGDFNAQLPGADATLRRSNLKVTSFVLAGLVNGLYGYIDWIWQQIFAFVPLWAFIFNLPRKAATAASGNGVFTGTSGTVIPSGTLWQDSALNQYSTTANGTITGGSATIPIAAQFAGSAGNLAPNAPLTIVTSLANVNPNGAVDGSGLSGGLDQETVAAWTARVQGWLQMPPQGGTLADYENWVVDNYAGATRAFAVNNGGGSVSIYFMMDNAYTNGIPQAADVTAVQAIINARAPGDITATVAAPTPSVVNFTIANVPTQLRAAVTAALTAMFKSVVGVSQALDLQSQIIPIVQAAALTPGVNVTSPSADQPAISGTIYTMGSVTFT